MMGPRTRSDRVFLTVAAVSFAVTTAVTIIWSLAMAAMGGVPMAGGWMMSMAWMPMCGQGWGEVAATFLAMWSVMMPAMMLPVLVPMLRCYRRAVGASNGLTALVCAGYFAVWALIGLLVFPLGAVLADITLRQPVLNRMMPVAVGGLVLAAGGLQFTAWKTRRLACCKRMPARAVTAWRHGVRLGLDCSICCANLMAILLVLGVMDLRVMAGVTVAIAAERLAPAPANVWIIRSIGTVAMGTGLFLILWP